jgi:transposase-like protein
MSSKYHLQYQSGLSLPEFYDNFGTREQCEDHLYKKKWPSGFTCKKCGSKAAVSFNKGKHTVYECSDCKAQTSLLVGTLFERTHLPLKTWYLAIYLISEAKTGIASLDLHRKLGVNHKTAWLMHHKIMHAMAIEETNNPISGRIEMDDAYLGGTLKGGSRGRGSENKQPFIAAVSTGNKNHPRQIKLDTINSFSRSDIEDWTSSHILARSHIVTDGLNCFKGVEKTCSHEIHVSSHISDEEKDTHFKWIDTILSNVKTLISGTFHSIEYKHFAFRYLAEITYRFNRRYDLKKIFYDLCDTVINTPPITARAISTC